jgi:hypothetical protein
MEYITYDLLSQAIFLFKRVDEFGMHHIIQRGDFKTSKYIGISSFD